MTGLHAEPAPHVSAVGHADMAAALRVLAMDAVEQAGSGHPGMPMGMADVATVLFARFANLDPSRPDWPDRDRFVLSAGHGSMLQYAVHHLLGYADMPMEELRRFRQLGARTAGHPEFGHALGIETTTGPLGQGLATAVGMALAERMLSARFGRALVDHFTYVIAGDGCLMEGISHEAIELAGHLRLARLIVLWDDNGITIDGPTSLSTSSDQSVRFRAAGWQVARVDGHDPEAVAEAIARARRSRRPSLIACRTVIGCGAPNKQGSEAVHGAPLGAGEVAAARARLGWPHPPFSIPDDVRRAWSAAAARGRAARAAWDGRLQRSRRRRAFERAIAALPSAGLTRALQSLRRELTGQAPKLPTRKASQLVLATVNAATDLTVGGSADLTHSNLTLTDGLEPVAPGRFSGRYIHYGVREHAMAAAMNGLALHGGFIPYGGTFLVFSDYARAAMRLSALMGLGVVYVMTHDSIGLGEDGPTHQPVEHLAMLRATPNTNIFRPADAVETAECWELALSMRRTPSVLCLSRQALPPVRSTPTSANLSGRGAYVLREAAGARDVTFLATGSEVSLALEAAERLAGEGLRAAVVSMPCWELFEAQDPEYRAGVLGRAPRIGIEAAARLGWDRWTGPDGAFVGMTGFGASAPAGALFEQFEITADAAARTARRLLATA